MKKLLGAVALLCATSTMALAEGELQLYNWGDYTNPDLLKKFEAETGIKVIVTDYDSNDTALAKIRAGGHGFDMVVPSANYVRIFVEEGLVQELDHSRLSNIGNIAPEWQDVDWDPGRKYSVPYQWGLTGIMVNRDVYKGDINTSALWLDTPDELKGKINVAPEMNDVINMAIWYVGGESCTEDPEVLRKVRDVLIAAKPNWISMDYGATEKMSSNDWAATVYWNGAALRSRINNPSVEFGYPKEGFPMFMDSVTILSDAKNVDGAYKFLNFIMEPENAALISAYARYANGITGSDPFMPEDMKGAPELNIPEELADSAYFLNACSPKANEYMTAIWTELMK